MRVGNLVQYLESLATALREGGASKPANDLSSVAASLQRLADWDVAKLAPLLDQTRIFLETGQLPAAAPTKRTTSRPSSLVAAPSVDQIIEEFRQLYERAGTPEVAYSTIEAAVKQWDKALNKDAALALAREAEISQSFRTKKDALAAIKQRLVDRKQSADRTRF